MTELEALISITHSLKHLENLFWWIAFWLFAIWMGLGMIYNRLH